MVQIGIENNPWSQVKIGIFSRVKDFNASYQRDGYLFDCNNGCKWVQGQNSPFLEKV